MGQFGSFVESESAYRRGCGYDPRIVAVQSVDVGPYLDLAGVQRGAEQRSGVIASAPLQVVYFARSVAANVALGNENPVEGITVYGFARMFPDKSHVRLPAFVRPYEIDCRQQGGMYSRLREIKVHQPGYDQFPLGQNDFFSGGGKGFPADFSHQRKAVLDMFFRLSRASCAAVKRVGDRRILVFQAGGVVQRAVHITAGQFRRDPGQRVGRSRHGRKYDHFGLFVADKSCDVFDSFDGAYRGASEFQDFYFPLLVIHWFVFLFAIWFAVPIGQLECRFPVS